MVWNQTYDPLGNWALSAVLAALPMLVLLGTLAVLRLKAHWSALLGLASALLISVAVFGMPAGKALAAAAMGGAYGLFPIGWIILNVIFLYNLVQDKGYFQVLQDSLTGITSDARLQLLLVAFSFGAFFEAAAGFGTPVAVTATILIGLGFSPLTSSALSLIANTAPVAFGGLGTPIIALAGVTGLDILKLSAMTGRQISIFSVIIPFWLIWAFAGFRGMAEIWPALLVAGFSYAIPQFIISNQHGPWLAGVGAALISIFALIGLLLIWRPKTTWRPTGKRPPGESPRPRPRRSRGEILKAWTPWLILSLIVFIWSLPAVKSFLDGIFLVQYPVPGVHGLIYRMPPVVSVPTPESAVISFSGLSFTGTGILVSALISAMLMGFRLRQAARTWWRTLQQLRFTLFTVAVMLGLGFVTRYAGLDAAMGLTLAKTGIFYPFFGTMLGWLGVALTGSDTSSNVLFGSLQKISAERAGLSPILMASANSSGGVMGKMIAAQSIVVASTATKWYGHEGEILRVVFFHSLALASLVGLLVFLQAYVFPFTKLIVK